MARRALLIATGIALLGFATFLLITQPRPSDQADLAGLSGDITRGAMVFAASGCASCHMEPGTEDELVLAGGMRFPTEFGTFVAPNISPDPTQGIGSWTLENFAQALRDGITPNGQHYFPALPYAAYSRMTGQDVVDLWAFMQSLPPSTAPSAPHEMGFPFNIRRPIGGWKLLYMTDDWQMIHTPTPELDRGRYVVEALAHCAECHTPRTALGGLDRSRWMAGAPSANGQGRVPNITPARLNWSASELFAYLTTGFTPEYDSVGGHMAHVVDNMAKLPPEDVQAVVSYLQALPAIE